MCLKQWCPVLSYTRSLPRPSIVMRRPGRKWYCCKIINTCNPEHSLKYYDMWLTVPALKYIILRVVSWTSARRLGVHTNPNVRLKSIKDQPISLFCIRAFITKPFYSLASLMEPRAKPAINAAPETCYLTMPGTSITVVSEIACRYLAFIKGHHVLTL